MLETGVKVEFRWWKMILFNLLSVLFNLKLRRCEMLSFLELITRYFNIGLTFHFHFFLFTNVLILKIHIFLLYHRLLLKILIILVIKVNRSVKMVRP